MLTKNRKRTFVENPFRDFIESNHICLKDWCKTNHLPYQVSLRLKNGNDISGSWLIVICKRSGIDPMKFSWV